MKGFCSTALGFLSLYVLLFVFFGVNLLFGQNARHEFKNPVVPQGQDPWVTYWQNNYYFCQSRQDGIWVNRASRLEDIGVDQWKHVWSPPLLGPFSRNIWAPEMHFLQGKWYIYFAADDGDNTNHRMYVLEGITSDPQKPFAFKNKLTSVDNHWAIDGTILKMPDGSLYCVWAGWPALTNGIQNLYIASMHNPWTIQGARICISKPDREWEQRDFPYIDEGPEILWHGDHLFIIYSASAFWDDNYCLGQLTWLGGDVLNSQSWIKNAEPVFQKSTAVFGPGHCSFVESPDHSEDWIVYHAHIARGMPKRDIRIQPFSWNSDGSPKFGIPISPDERQLPPSGEFKK